MRGFRDALEQSEKDGVAIGHFKGPTSTVADRRRPFENLARFFLLRMFGLGDPRALASR